MAPVAPLQIEYRPIEALIPSARNARTHSDEQVALIAGSIREWGWTNPVLVDGENGIIAGHGRVLAARKLRMDKVPCIELRHMSEDQKRAYMIADNQTALRAGWDDEMLRNELQALASAGFDVGLVGFAPLELDKLLAPPPTDGLTDPDEAPDVPNQPVAKEDDVWLLGRHRLVCGDATAAAAVEAALKGVTPHLMVTDPPYGVEYDPKWRNERVKTQQEKVAARGTGQVQNDGRADWREAWALFPGDVVYIWCAGQRYGDAEAGVKAAEFTVRCQIIWHKPHFAIGRGDYHWQHEPCIYAVRKGKVGHWNGDRKQSTVWTIEPRIGWMTTRKGSEDPFTGHGTQKPIECMQRPIENNSSPGQAVYDPFVGSGTSIIAAERTGRACHALELNPGYVDVSILRWQSFTGKNAVLEASGQTFTEVAGDRRPGNVLTLGKKAEEFKQKARKR